LIPKKSPKPLIRLGSSLDGGYLLPDDLKGISRCLSPGVNNFKFFEDDLATKHNIKCDLVDASSDVDCFATQLIDGMQTFYPQWLDTNNSSDSLSIAEWITMHSGDREDFLLQIDIEGPSTEIFCQQMITTLAAFEYSSLSYIVSPPLLQDQEYFMR
jgi:hypothetical protein